MTPEQKTYCDQHFEFAKHIGVTERALKDIDKKIDKLFELMENAQKAVNKARTETHGIREVLKARWVEIGILLSMLSIAAKLWSQ